jgi:hypothetical protein
MICLRGELYTHLLQIMWRCRYGQECLFAECTQPCPEPRRQAFYLHLWYKLSWVIIDFKYWNNILWMMPLQTTSALFLALRMRSIFIFRIAMTRLWDLSFGIHMATSLYSRFLLSVTLKKTASRVCVSVFNSSRPFRTYAVVNVPEGPAQVVIEYACVQLCTRMYMQGRPFEIQTLTTGTWLAAPRLPHHLCYLPAVCFGHLRLTAFSFRQGKLPASLIKCYQFCFIACLKLRNSGSVCAPYRSHLFCLDKRQVFRTSCPWSSSHYIPHYPVRSKTSVNFSLRWSRLVY